MSTGRIASYRAENSNPTVRDTDPTGARCRLSPDRRRWNRLWFVRETQRDAVPDSDDDSEEISPEILLSVQSRLLVFPIRSVPHSGDMARLDLGRAAVGQPRTFRQLLAEPYKAELSSGRDEKSTRRLLVWRGIAEVAVWDCDSAADEYNWSVCIHYTLRHCD